MKVYFTYSSSIPKSSLNQISELLVQLNLDTTYRKHPENYYALKSKDARLVFKKNILSIKRAQFVIAEMSFASSGLGYEVSQAIDAKKPILALYNFTDYRNITGNLDVIPVNMQGNNSKYLILKEYQLSNLKKILENGIQSIRDLLNTKFNLILPNDINEYLEWVSKTDNISKSDIVRDSIRKKRDLDERYINY